MVIVIMIKYKKTSNPNVIKKIETIESEIRLDELEKQIQDLKAQLDNIPEPKTEPDQETLDFWNEMMPLANIEDIKIELKEKEKLLAQLKKL